MNKTKVFMTAAALVLAIGGAFATKVDPQEVYQKLNVQGTSCERIFECTVSGAENCLYSVTSEQLFILDQESKCLVPASKPIQ